MNDTIKDNLKAGSTWSRILYMIIFVVIFNVVEILIALLVTFQVLVLLFTGRTNERVVDFGAQLGRYLLRIVRYLTFNSESLPFPFADWDSEPDDEADSSGV